MAHHVARLFLTCAILCIICLALIDWHGARGDAQWKKVDKGTKIVFHRKKDPASHLRVAEVLELDKAERKLTVWYYIHSSSDYDVER